MKCAYFFVLKFKWMISSIIILLLILFLWSLSWHQTRPKAITTSSIAKRRQARSPMLAIKGFAFDDYQGDRKTLSIKADFLVVDKKKIGFFRFGLINAAKLEKAIIDIYLVAKPPAQPISAPPFDYNIQRAKTTQSAIKKIDFKNAFSPTIFKSIIKKKITTLEMEPVTIRIHDNKGVSLTIESGYSKIGLKDGAIIFKKRVRVTAGPKILTTKKLSLFPHRGLFRTNSSFVLKTPQRECRGDYLETDLYLDHVYTGNSQAEKKPENCRHKDWSFFKFSKIKLIN